MAGHLDRTLDIDSSLSDRIIRTKFSVETREHSLSRKAIPVRIFRIFLAFPVLALAGTFSGTVVDLTGAPVVGAVVKTAGDSAITAGDGTWSLARTLSVVQRKAMPVSVASHLVVENGRPRLVFCGVDASGHRSPEGSVQSASLQTPAGRATAAAGTDTLTLYWKGKQLVVLPIASSDSTGIVLSIDTAWSDDQGIPWNGRITYGSLKDDRDAHVYRTVAIASQIWVAENLDYAVDSSFCLENSSDSCAKYGRLYEWAAAMGLDPMYDTIRWSGADSSSHQGTCPSGWRIPLTSDWDSLFAHVGSDSSKLALSATESWHQYPSSWILNKDTYGFRILSNGDADTGVFQFYPGQEAEFWSASPQPGGESVAALYEDAFYYSSRLYQQPAYKTYAFAIRCLKD